MSFLKITIFLLCVAFIQAADDSYNEELLLYPLPNGHVYSYFQFTTKWEADLKNAQHTHLFSRVLAEILQKFQVRELHISMTQGLWRHEQWGYPLVDAPPGAEVWAWFEPETQNVDQNWKLLTDTLSGLLCASLNFIDTTNSVVPRYTFRPEGTIPDNGEFNETHVRYTSLPREIVCTENLTPWKKLLPCDAHKGFASLLNAAQIHNTRYHSLGLHVRQICAKPDCKSTILESRQTVSLVYDLALMVNKKDWSFRHLFGHGLVKKCVLASSSIVYVDVTSNFTNYYQLSMEPTKFVNLDRGGFTRRYAVYDLSSDKFPEIFSISSRSLVKESKILPKSPPPIVAHRYLVGYGQERGGITTRIHNNHWSDIDIIFSDQIPWFIEIYLHTLNIESNGKLIRHKILHYVPGQPRTRSYYMEIALRLPAQSITTLTIKFNYVFLKWQEYPPDANHGFYIGSAVISTVLPTAKNYTAIPSSGSLFADVFDHKIQRNYPVRIYTEIILVTLPTPDFSMPYNVVCLACTVIALAFGPLHNITTKRLQRRKIEDVRKNIIATVIGKLKSIVSKKKD